GAYRGWRELLLPRTHLTPVHAPADVAPSGRGIAMAPGNTRGSLPRWLKPANRLVIALQRLGLRTGTIHVLTVRGRTSGTMRSTPVWMLTVAGPLYLIGGMADADWVQNVRAAGPGILASGRHSERVTLTELPVAERGAILREFPRRVPAGVFYFR